MLQRMLIDRMENRILVGIIMFVGIMILVGWVGINENARMASFERQHLARSIERGAELYAGACATCHGNDGRGLSGRAPGLNNPHLFGFDYFASVNRELTLLETEEVALTAELAELTDEALAEDITEERLEEILERRREIGDFLSGEDGIAVQRAALAEQRDAVIAQLQSAIDSGYPIRTDLDSDGNEILIIESDRLAQVAFGGTLHDFIFTTLVSGRPTSISYWPEQMPSWSQRTGAPFRDDQLNDITNYILNFDRGSNWTIEDLLAVNQFAIAPGVGGVDPADLQPPAGNDVEAILTRIEEQGIEGDPVRGEDLYYDRTRSQRSATLGCSGCHTIPGVAPLVEGTWDRVITERLPLPQFQDYTPEAYIVESIVLPGAYVAPPYPNSMPSDFGQRTSIQDIADLVAFLSTTEGDNGE